MPVNKFKYLIVINFLLLASSNLKAGDFFIPIEVPEYRILYDYLNRLNIENGFDRQIGRLTSLYEDGNFPNHPIFGWRLPNRSQLKTFALLTEDFSTKKYSRARGYESVRAGIMAAPAKNFMLYASFVLDERLADNPEYSGKKWRDLAGEIETAMAVYCNRKLSVMAGRFGSSWGPVRQSLILSETARPMDAVQFRYKWGFILFTSQLGMLSRIRSVDEYENGYENRYFAGHRLDVMMSRNLYLGFFETVIYGGKGRGIEAAYFNPLMFYHAFQLNEDYDDNTFLGLDFAWYLNDCHKIYGQLMVDDFQIDNETRGDNEPNEIGYQLGVHSIDLFSMFDIRAEYLRITNWTYNQLYQRNRYTNRGELIGHDFGPDGDRYTFSIERWFEDDKRASLNFLYQRRGEGRFDSQWSEPWLDADNYSEPFPTGTVEKKFSVSLGFTGYPARFLYLDAMGGYDFIDNYNHVDGNSRTVPFFSIRLSLILSARINVQ